LICVNCRVAGEYNREANVFEELNPTALAGGIEILRSEARLHHSACLDINCPCQHYIGKVMSESHDEKQAD